MEKATATVKPTLLEKVIFLAGMATLFSTIPVQVLCGLGFVAGIVLWILGGFGTLPFALMVGAVVLFFLAGYFANQVGSGIAKYAETVMTRTEK